MGDNLRRTIAWSVIFVTAAVLAISAHAGVIRAGNRRCAGVALTFDLCPVSGTGGFDEPLINFLREHQIHATFFASGSWAARHEIAFRSLLAVPYFEIGTHGETHVSLPGLSRDEQEREIYGPVARIAAESGRIPTLFRPPFGRFSPVTLEIAESHGLKFVLWSVVSGDADPNLPAARIEQVMDERMRGGSIFIFHANGRGRHTREVIEALFSRLIERRLVPLTVSELLVCPINTVDEH
jgi:peptidoglycan/xylan/chitin deacetylase (PgdA/CDA1 family)